ncbi:capsular biosynthesis protein [Novosphingobium sp.]|uniref:capsule biosynthesis protein n=1 Tax=Novosphingobium sp. TaxID=1874826 RepID=UPI0025D31F22|nr:capsular biosynthesis protein [Novosphingobium sp.]
MAQSVSLPMRILLLQGLMGPLFRRLGQDLIAAGHTVFKVNFNGGDRAFWRLPNSFNYQGKLSDWPKAFDLILTETGVSDVVLFGDCRDYHLPAIQICRDRGVKIHVFEEGYIRPDWVTLELGGVNGNSSLPRDPAWYRRTASTLPPVPVHAQVPSSFRRRAIEGLLYNAADLLTRWQFPNWSNHRPWHPVVEGMGWWRKLWRSKEREESSSRLMAQLAESKTEYFVFPLQLDSDYQIRLHSPFAGVADALRLVIESFAGHAPQHIRLVVKEHPLDNGVRDWRQVTFDMANLFGAQGRVDYLATGDIVPITRGSRGIVTINSTSGTFALAEGLPVVVLGQAVYDIVDITHKGGLDRFWTNPQPPDAQTFEAFYKVMVDRCLIPGGFYSDEALAKVLRHAVARLEGRAILPE